MIPDIAVTIVDPTLKQRDLRAGVRRRPRQWRPDRQTSRASRVRCGSSTRPPGPCRYSCRSGGPGGAVTAYANTWALGPLKPGATAKFVWGVTAVKSGRHVVQYQVAAGLNGKAKRGARGRRRQALGHVQGQRLKQAPAVLRERRRPGRSRRSAASALLGGSQRLIPPSTANWSIAASSSGSNSRLSSAATFCSSCLTLLAPSRAEVTRSSRSTQAIAIWASV